MPHYLGSRHQVLFSSISFRYDNAVRPFSSLPINNYTFGHIWLIMKSLPDLSIYGFNIIGLALLILLKKWGRERVVWIELRPSPMGKNRLPHCTTLPPVDYVPVPPSTTSPIGDLNGTNRTSWLIFGECVMVRRAYPVRPQLTTWEHTFLVVHSSFWPDAA